jgi:hypothetical protein
MGRPASWIKRYLAFKEGAISCKVSVEWLAGDTHGLASDIRLKEEAMTQIRINLEESEIPTHWYTVVAGGLEDYAYPEEAIRDSIAHLPKVPA